MDWTAVVISGGTWIQIVSGLSGRDAGTVTLAYDANSGGETNRTAIIRVTVAGADDGSSVDVTVTQSACSGVVFEHASVVTAGEGNSGSGAFNAVVPVFGVGPASVPVYVLPGSAGTSDYVAPTKPITLTWADGQSGTTNVVIPIKGDRLVEGNEVFYLALGTPTAGELGEQTVCAVTITDDDVGTVPNKGVYVAGLPQPPEGGSVSGGAYCLPNKSVRLTAKAKTGWTFLNWDNGSQVAVRTVTGGEASEAAQGGVMPCFAYFKKTADLALPTTENPGAQSGMVGVIFNLPLDVTSECLPKVTVTGLPVGLKYDANQVCISGVPTKAGTFNVAFAASNPKGSASAQAFAITVAALPAWAQGTFNGWAEADGLDAGGASLSVSALGAASGKFMLRGTNFAFSAAGYAAEEEGLYFHLTATATVANVSIPLEFTVAQPEIPEVAGVLPSALSVAAHRCYWGDPAPVDGLDVAVQLYRSVWRDAGMTAVATNWAGYYTATLPGGDGYGSGYLAFTVDTSGNVKTAGKLADGTAVSLSGTLILDGAGRVFAVLYTAPTAYKGGGLFGVAEFVKPDSGPVTVRLLDDDSFLWNSFNPQATGEYGAGFAHELGISGGWYNSVINLRDYYGNGLTVGGVDLPRLAATVKVTDWDDTSTRKVTQSVTDVFDAAGDASPNGVVLGVTPATGAGTGLSAPKSDAPVKDTETGAYIYADTTGDGVNNTSGLTLRFTRATGLFTGTFKAWYDYVSASDLTVDTETWTHTSKSVTYQGALTPVRDSGDAEGRGFFLWADKGAYENTAGKTVTYGFNASYDFLLLGL